MYKSTELTTKYTTKFGTPPRPLLAFLVWASRSHIESLWKSLDSKTSSIAYILLAFLRFTENFGFHLRIFCDYVPTATTSPLRLCSTATALFHVHTLLRLNPLQRIYGIYGILGFAEISLHSTFLRLTREPLKACTPQPLLSWYLWVLSSISHS